MPPAPPPPTIITTDLTSPHPHPAPAVEDSPRLSPRSHRHTLSASSDPSHLRPEGHSPFPGGSPAGRGHSPAPSWSSSSGLVPPSPTLTSSSVHFSEELLTPTTPQGQHTSLALRDNHPTAESGTDTLGVIGENEPFRQRGWSVGTYSTQVGTPERQKSAQFGLPTPATSLGPPSAHRPEPKRTWKDKLLRRQPQDAEEPEGDAPDALEGKKGKEVTMAHLDPDKDTTDPTPFREKPSRLAMLVDPKSLADVEKVGGTPGLLEGLGIDGSKGVLDGSDPSQGSQGQSGAQWTASLDKRREVYGRNDLPERQSKSLLMLMWLAFKDKVLILLTVAAIVSLALGLYTDLGTEAHITYTSDCPQGCAEPKVDWVEGVAIVVAIAIVVLVGSINDWQKERQFKKLNAQREDRTVKAIRNGREVVINVKDVVVGDICLLEPGEIVPVDGVFLRGHGVRCDESAATGESDAIRKFSYEECIEERDGLKDGQKAKKDCFLVSGAKVLEGVGEYVVIAVGSNSFHGRILMSMRGESENTPLQIKLNALAELIAKAGAGSGLILFICLMIRFFVQLKTDPDRSANDKAQSFVQILIISVTLIVVAVPEGLPLAVTLALAFATKRMTKQNLLVRVLGSCETMGHATVVCTDKTGTLTQNVMTVVAGSLGVHGKFVRNISDNASRSNVDEEDARVRQDFSFDMSDFNHVASPELQQLVNEAIAINSTAFEDKNEAGELEFVGSKTETALLRFAKELGWADYRQTREGATIVQMIPFSSELKAMGVVVKLPNGKHRLYTKGASEILTKACTAHVAVHEQGGPEGVQVVPFTEDAIANISKTIIFYANQSLRTLAVCYRDFDDWPPASAAGRPVDDVPFHALARELTLIMIAGIEDPLRDGVREAVSECQRAGVAVKMCTGDNVLTARSIANQCGIFTPGGVIMEGPAFRKMSDFERLEIVPRLQILARSSPEDKRLLVKTLKGMGEVVGVTGDGTNDGPALKLANVGFAMGIAGTEVAKEASDIILMDDSFKNVVLAVIWGRCINDSVKKFLQFQISVNITAVVITFVSAVASNSESSVLTAVQLLWVNLIMDTFAALALATDPATKASLDRKPDHKTAPLISIDMIKMIITQAVYQIAVCLILHFLGMRILKMDNNDENQTLLSTLVFNCFVLCQIFNQLNCRRLDRKYNVLEGFFRNYWFIGIFIIMVAGQILIVEVGGAAFTVTRLHGREWGISIVVGFLSIPLGVLVRLCPTEPIERFLIAHHLYPDPNKLPTSAPEVVQEKYEYNPALSKIKDNLSTYANIRGGRLRASSIVAKSRSAQLKEADITLPNLLTMVPTLIGGAIGAGARWVNPTPASLSDPASQDPSRSTAELFAGKVQLHPDTDPNDPLYARFGIARDQS